MTLAPDIDLTTPWKERDKIDKADAVRQLVERQGMTGSQAAQILGTTRNSVIGVAERAKIAASASPERAAMIDARRNKARLDHFAGRRAQGLQAMPRKPKPVPQPKVKRENAPKPTADPKLNQLPPPPDKAWLALAGSTPRPLAEHNRENGECLWPLGDRPMLFCCLPIDKGSAYCPTHRALGFRALPAKGTTV